MEEFFLTCPIGTEKFLKREFEFKWRLYFGDALPQSILDKGGMTINCPLEQGLLLNNILKCPSKILLRLKQQKCRDIPKLFNIIKKFPWKSYLNQAQVNFNVTAKKSRLIHTQKIENACHDGMSAYFQANKIKSQLLIEHKDDPRQSIYIRLFNDELTISLDTSGELLHIRGDNQFRGHAPIRENIASLLLWSLPESILTSKGNLIDPMCGTGTFLKEARDQFQLSNRMFNYMYLNKVLIKDLPSLSHSNTLWPWKFYGYDIDPDIIKHNQYDGIEFKTQDLFNSPSPVFNMPNFVIINPPYGKRVKIQGDKYDYFKELIKNVQKIYMPACLALIIPTPFDKGIKGHKLYFKQNGIDVCFVTMLKK